ncbi:hypothetical protein NIES4071_107260 (plasmid) [Calothrix sp. NIES-4071]|nr:hypothetical protein NIES4071_107260 [Calothrix sp. NIES-4071]BAZ64766.1 hypothetical protein NIES4105_104990 [Calothrix sp. NIES-4105]
MNVSQWDTLETYEMFVVQVDDGKQFVLIFWVSAPMHQTNL